SACCSKLGRRLGAAHAWGQRAGRGGAAGEIEPAVLAVVVELAAGERLPEIGGGEALTNGALAQHLVQPSLRRGEVVEPISMFHTTNGAAKPQATAAVALDCGKAAPVRARSATKAAR